jgi:hypothetical protein
MRCVLRGSAVVESTTIRPSRPFEYAVRAVHGVLYFYRRRQAQEQHVGDTRDVGNRFCLSCAECDEIVDRCSIAVAHDGQRWPFCSMFFAAPCPMRPTPI